MSDHNNEYVLTTHLSGVQAILNAMGALMSMLAGDATTANYSLNSATHMLMGMTPEDLKSLDEELVRLGQRIADEGYCLHCGEKHDEVPIEPPPGQLLH